MNKITILKFLAALLCCFLLGCCATLVIHLYDRYFDMPDMLTGGQTIDFTAYGFTLAVPDDYALNDYTANNFSEGGDALFAGCAYGGGEELYIYCYDNPQDDAIADHPESTLVSHYMAAGAQEVRTRTLGGRRFICYRVEVAAQDGNERWDTYETWDKDIHLVFETRMNPWDVLPMLQTISFSQNVPADQ
ncbi:MAG: hypothetical protein IKU34_03775 [Clostridia bacterium]|nr:hypothetical protein [Clostridia bacterium]